MERKNLFQVGENVFTKVKGKNCWGSRYFLVYGGMPDWLADIDVPAEECPVVIDELIGCDTENLKKSIKVVESGHMVGNSHVDTFRFVNSDVKIRKEYYLLFKELFPKCQFYTREAAAIVVKVGNKIVGLCAPIITKYAESITDVLNNNLTVEDRDDTPESTDAECREGELAGSGDRLDEVVS
jgi:hypothetical protein